MMKMISWNVNGLRAAMGKGFMDFFRQQDADIFCLQETKLQEGQIELDMPGYYQYWNYAEKKGYSGTAVFTKKKPVNVMLGIGVEEHDREGRVITLEFDEFYFITVYTPNSQNELARLPYRMEWEDDFLEYVKGLEKDKPVIYAGDLNVARLEIDIKNPKTNRRNAGFTDEEREKIQKAVDSGFIDTFRFFNPQIEGIYSWWSYRFKAIAAVISLSGISITLPVDESISKSFCLSSSCQSFSSSTRRTPLETATGVLGMIHWTLTSSGRAFLYLSKFHPAATETIDFPERLTPILLRTSSI